MDIEAVLPRVLLVALSAGKWLVTGVDKLMSFQMSLRNELLVTTFLVANKRSVPCLCHSGLISNSALHVFASEFSGCLFL